MKGVDMANISRRRRYATVEESFAARTRWVDDCLIWEGCTTPSGYGLMSIGGGRRDMVHRYAWIRANGPIEVGFEVDHVCRNRACCNVDHLRLATRRQNMRNRDGAQSTSTTGVRNVRVEGGRFRVIVNRVHIGTFPSLNEAQQVAEVARDAAFGQFAGRG